MKTIYLFSGIGCNDVIFTSMEVPDGYTMRFVPWIEPLRKESVEDYLSRMTKDLTIAQSDILLGVSLGGIAVQILAKIRPEVSRIVLISTAVSAEEYSPFLTRIRRYSLHKMVPAAIFTNRRLLAFLVTGSMKSRYTRHVKLILAGMSASYFRMAINMAMDFSGVEMPRVQVLRIHGGRDVLFPAPGLVSDTRVLCGASHLALYTHSREINRLIGDFILSDVNR